MDLKTGILIISLVIGLLGVPSCIFAQEYQDISSNTVLKSSSSAIMQLNSLNPEVKGSSGGRSSSSSSSKSSSSKVKVGDGDDDADGTGFDWTTIIIILVVLGIIGVLVWYFVLRK